MLETKVLRVPIKVRQSIHKDFCNCQGVKIFSIDSIPYFILGNDLSQDQILNFLSTSEVGVGVYISDNDKKFLAKAEVVLDMGLPVTINTSRVIPNRVLSKMQKVPHSSIHVSIDFLEDCLENPLEIASPRLLALQEMMFLSKSWKIFTGLHVKHKPYLIGKFDLYEVITLYKNCMQHMLIEFPMVSASLLQRNFSLLRTDQVGRFRKYYEEIPFMLQWKLKQSYKTQFIPQLHKFLKCKKITLETVDAFSDTPSPRIRYVKSGLCTHPLGMKSFFYEKKGGKFVECNADIRGHKCLECGKDIF